MSKKKPVPPEEQPHYLHMQRLGWRQQACSSYEARALRDAKTVWLRAYCASIEAFTVDEAADNADAAVKAFTRRFYGCS